MSGITKLQNRFDTMAGRTTRDNVDLDELMADDSDIPHILRNDGGTVPEDDDLDAYYYLMNDGPFLNN